MCGLRNDTKRKETMLHFRGKADIICMQECHNTEDVSKFWKNEWKGDIRWSHGLTDSRG